MPTYLVEVEESTLTIYRVKAANRDAARKAVFGDGDYPIVEEHNQAEVVNCVECEP